jgi:hypothetical protein
MKARELGWLLLLLALSKRRPPSSPRWKIPEGPPTEDNSIPSQPVLPPPPDFSKPPPP